VRETARGKIRGGQKKGKGSTTIITKWYVRTDWTVTGMVKYGRETSKHIGRQVIVKAGNHRIG
jgi:hypothetical protein